MGSGMNMLMLIIHAPVNCCLGIHNKVLTQKLKLTTSLMNTIEVGDCFVAF